MDAANSTDQNKHDKMAKLVERREGMLEHLPDVRLRPQTFPVHGIGGDVGDKPFLSPPADRLVSLRGIAVGILVFERHEVMCSVGTIPDDVVVL